MGERQRQRQREGLRSKTRGGYASAWRVKGQRLSVMFSTAANPYPEAGIEIIGAPDDTVSKLKWSPPSQQQLLMGASWDKSVRIWNVDQSGNSQAVCKYDHEAPVLSCDWATSGASVFSADGVGKVMMYDLTAQKGQQIGEHQGAVIGTRFVPDHNLIMTCGMEDGTVRYWDGRQSKAVLEVAPSVSQFAVAPTVADAANNLLVIGAGREYKLFDMRNPGQPYKRRESLLAFQVTCIAIFNNPLGWAEGSIEGRVAINTEEDPPNTQKHPTPSQQKIKDANFTFKCHRHPLSTAQRGGVQSAHTVNDIAFSNAHGTFATCGSDGYIKTWCRIRKRKIKIFQVAAYPVTAVAFSADSNILAYAIGYDWHQGHAANNPTQQRPAICLKRTMDDKGSMIEPPPPTQKKF